jgi:serine/threonine protein kinase/threonine/homoserine/homoserine lactone efflux protein
MNLSASPSDDAVVPPGSPRAGQAGEGSSSRLAAIKFLYPTGSRPLDGYTIKRGVGRGGFGEVYFATSDAGKEVALKLIRRNLDVELRGVTHCLNLKHNNLISLYDIREDESGDQWVIMEYVAGDSLEQAIERHPQGMPEADVLRWFSEMCAGVAYLHDHGIVHRDLKPANVFLDGYSGSGGTVKIGDYGLAKFISCSRRSGQTESVGTVHYMAPEIANGRYGREVDTYALGIILYEMLTGRVPFEGESMGEVIMKHLTAEPDLQAVPLAFREAVARTLAKDPELRVSSVGELMALLPGGVAQPASTTPQPAPDGLGDSRQFTNTVVRGDRHADKPSDKPLSFVPEPLFQAVCDNWRRAVDNWHHWDINPAFKGLLLFAGIGFLLLTSAWWFVFAAFVGIIYVAYYIFWSVFIEPGVRANRRQSAARQPRGLAAQGLVAARPTVARRRLKPHEWIPIAHQELRSKPLRETLGGWVVSLLGSAIVCTFLSLLVPIIFSDVPAVDRQAMHLWFSVVTTAAVWSVMTVNRFGEGRFEDQVPLRTIMLGMGLGVGALAYAMSQVLLIGVPFESDFGVGPSDTMLYSFAKLPSTTNGDVYSPLANVELASSVLYFALLFVTLRWWRLGEYVREHRFAFWRTAFFVGAAWCLHLVCWYPQPAGIVVAGISAAAIQLSSPWLRPSQRKALAEPVV